MDKDVAVALITAAAPVVLAGIGFFIRSYFKHIEAAIHDHARESAAALGELKGQLTTMQTDLRSNTIEVTKAATNITALWRYVDGAGKRASDLANGPG